MSSRLRISLAGIAVAMVTALIFLPSLSGAFLNWDDGRLIEFSAWRGFSPENVRWWFVSFAGGDFKPLAWASYALDHAFWGLNPFGYHLGNVVLHSLNAALLFFLLSSFSLSAGARTCPDVPETGLRGDCGRSLKSESKVRAYETSSCPAGYSPGKVAAGFSLRGASRADQPGQPRPQQTQAKACGYLRTWSAVVAALFFSLHPLRVETVAWITERKGCLSGFFFLLSLLLYMGYARRRRAGRAAGRYYWGSLAAGISACLAKPSAVSLPFALLILDVYPLRRTKEGSKRLLAEKLPYLLVSLGAGMMAWAGQRASAALAPMDDIGLAGRFLLAARSALFYLGKTIWPVHLSPVYVQVQPSIGIAAFASPAALLGGLLIFLLLWKRKIRSPLAAFLLYLVLLFPTSGFFRTGAVAQADRFAYLPAVALSIALAVLLSSLAGRVLPAALGVAGVGLAGLAFLAVHEQAVWRSSNDLWGEASVRSPSSALVFNNLGRALADEGLFDRAQEAYRRALSLEPGSPEANTNLGNLRARVGDMANAAVHYREALKTPSRFSPEAHNNLGNVLAQAGRVDEAIAHLEEALSLKPGYPEALNNLGNTLAMKGDLKAAEARYREAIRLKPDYPDAYLGLGGILQETGRLGEAIESFRRCVGIAPSRPDANYYLGKALESAGRGDEAEAYLRKAALLGKKR